MINFKFKSDLRGKSAQIKICAIREIRGRIFAKSAGDYTNKLRNSNLFPSKRPLSLSFSWGITSNARNESVI